MPVDLKHELTRPLALILAAFAALGWMLFVLSSWSTGSVQKAQRLQIMEVTEKNERLTTELARQVAAAGAISDLEAKVAATREDLTRMSQAKADVQAELSTAQRSLTSARRDLSDTDRSLQSQAQKLTELQSNAAEAASAIPDAAPAVGRSSRRGRGYSRRRFRSYSIISRSR